MAFAAVRREGPTPPPSAPGIAQAAQCIEIVGGESSIVLKGGDITFTCAFAVHGNGHAFGGGGSAGANKGPLDTQWGATDFDAQLRDAKIGLPALPGQTIN